MRCRIKYNVKTNKPINSKESKKYADQNITKAPIYEYPKLDSENLLRAIQGQVNPEFVTDAPKIIHQQGDPLPKQ
ncbi:hypothetical protein GCK32_007268 [Trichostrongylus colubriformis]|uniref:Uncharacterized protein n=1 Tax=Trichostrongylus colubriformis TaxID=6319 RepID=A0AAN8G2C1_TRICO